MYGKEWLFAGKNRITIPCVLRPVGIVIHISLYNRREITRTERIGRIDGVFQRIAGSNDLGQHLQPDNIEPAYTALSGKFPCPFLYYRITEGGLRKAWRQVGQAGAEARTRLMAA
jgi:hypothetical protein